MNNVYVVVSLLLLAFATPSLGQDVPGLNTEDLAGAKILKTDSYTGKALFGYIDGGAELYLEYGLKKLGRQEISYSKEKFVVEIYQMAGANEAYGIFSVQRFKCIPLDSTLPNTCLSKYQLQAAVGDCYLSIINESGSAAAQKGSVEIYRSLHARIKQQRLQLPQMFQNNMLKPFMRNLVIAQGPLGIQNGYPDWLSYFESFETFTLFLLPLDVGRSHLVVAYVRIPCCGEVEEFAQLAGFEGPLTETLRTESKDGTHMFARKLGKQILLFAVGKGSRAELTEFLRPLFL